MGYERYPRGTNPQGDYYGRRETQDYGRDYGGGRDYGYSSAREYAASGEYDRGTERYRDADRGRDPGREREYGNYGQREYGNAGYEDRSGRNYGGNRDHRDQDDRWSRGSYYGVSQSQSRGNWGDDNRGGYRGQRSGQNRDYGRQPQGYDYEDRGFLSRAGDEVRSWFGDDEAERRREADARYDERYYASQSSDDRDSDYRSWRSGQIAALDRDYDEYRRENRDKFHSEFGSWRTKRQSQRDQLGTVQEHAEVVGSDGEHVGTVDKTRGDRLILTKTDTDAGGRHHSIPSSWIQSADATKVTLSKTADEAKRRWKDEETNQALFNERDQATGDTQGRVLNRSFSGTY